LENISKLKSIARKYNIENSLNTVCTK